MHGWQVHAYGRRRALLSNIETGLKTCCAECLCHGICGSKTGHTDGQSATGVRGASHVPTAASVGQGE